MPEFRRFLQASLSHPPVAPAGQVERLDLPQVRTMGFDAPTWRAKLPGAPGVMSAAQVRGVSRPLLACNAAAEAGWPAVRITVTAAPTSSSQEFGHPALSGAVPVTARAGLSKTARSPRSHGAGVAVHGGLGTLRYEASNEDAELSGIAVKRAYGQGPAAGVPSYPHPGAKVTSGRQTGATSAGVRQDAAAPQGRSRFGEPSAIESLPQGLAQTSSQIYTACERGDERELRRLLTHPYRERDSVSRVCGQPRADGLTPLHVAAAFGHWPCIRTLLEHADIDPYARTVRSDLRFTEVAALRGQCAVLAGLQHWAQENPGRRMDLANDLLHRQSPSGLTPEGIAMLCKRDLLERCGRESRGRGIHSREEQRLNVQRIVQWEDCIWQLRRRCAGLADFDDAPLAVLNALLNRNEALRSSTPEEMRTPYLGLLPVHWAARNLQVDALHTICDRFWIEAPEVLWSAPVGWSSTQIGKSGYLAHLIASRPPLVAPEARPLDRRLSSALSTRQGAALEVLKCFDRPIASRPAHSQRHVPFCGEPTPLVRRRSIPAPTRAERTGPVPQAERLSELKAAAYEVLARRGQSPKRSHVQAPPLGPS